MTRKQKRLLMTIVAFVFVVITYFNNQAVTQPTQTTSQAEQPKVTPSPLSSPIVASNSADQNQTYLVTRVIDGDTIEIEGGQKIRYIGIDTPENTTQKECFGVEASNKNKELVLNKQIKLEKDVSETDRYGRLLRYVYVDDTFINELLVTEGYAQARSYPPDISKQVLFRTAEEQARAAKKGLWGSICQSQL